MSRPRLFATAAFTAVFPILLFTAGLQHVPRLAPTTLLVAILLVTLAAAIVYRPRQDPRDRIVALLADVTPALGLVFTTIAAGAFLCLELGTFALAGMVLHEEGPYPLLARWPVAVLWLIATGLGWWRWRTGTWPLAWILLPALGAMLLLWFQNATNTHLATGLWGDRWPLRLGIAAALLLVLLAGTLAYANGSPARRVTNQITTGATAVVLAVGYLGAVLEACSHLGPGPLAADGPPAAGAPMGVGPVGFATAETTLDAVYQAFGGSVVATTVDLWQWPLLAGITGAVVLFGRAATDRIDTLRLAVTTTAAVDGHRRGYAPRLHPHRASRLAHTVASGAFTALVIADYPMTLSYLAHTIAAVGLAILASLTLVAVGVDRLVEAETLPWAQAAAVFILATLPTCVAVVYLPDILGWSWTMPQLRAIPTGYLLATAAATGTGWWLHRYRPAAHARVSLSIAGTPADPYFLVPLTRHPGWTTRDGDTVRIGDTVHFTTTNGEPANGIIQAADTERGLPVVRTTDDRLLAVLPSDILTPATAGTRP